MRALVLALSLAPAPAMAERIVCQLGEVTLGFEIDRAQFAPAVDGGEPPRRAETLVEMGGDRFLAEPILMATGHRGFWAESHEGRELLLLIAPDGSARLSDSGRDADLEGTCSERE
ncbi:hypothetical protein [Aestuariicoccus sp. MJ-SS9]|uniref:hypothetical protein n=1 Tax=Aestuariicoccus sp. MJ-SS9 TaxID=3079855 RepID=UPI002909EE79|nr:hypothetical protein [Aestuariicoccus sp. MJ-SS9]MDU8912114.1 hypothetical protein [Aestuariicoccus sp. MJ-SS9]